MELISELLNESICFFDILDPFREKFRFNALFGELAFEFIVFTVEISICGQLTFLYLTGKRELVEAKEGLQLAVFSVKCSTSLLK